MKNAQNKRARGVLSAAACALRAVYSEIARKKCCKERKIMVDFEFQDHYTFEDLLNIVRILRHPAGAPGTASRPTKACAAA